MKALHFQKSFLSLLVYFIIRNGKKMVVEIYFPVMYIAKTNAEPLCSQL